MNRLKTTAALTLLLAAPLSTRAEVAFSGRLDMDSTPSIGAWQSVRDESQAIGISKRIIVVSKDSTEVLSLGVFAGAVKPLLTEPGTPPSAIGGLTVGIPGSLLDAALGTKMGDAWVPRLKAGVLVGYDLTRPKALSFDPRFVGVGVSYRIGGGSK